MKELLVIGFSEKHRALEVLPQLQRLHFAWSGDLQNAVAVEVERDGRLKLFQGLLLDAATGPEDAAQWKAILSAISPPPLRHTPGLSASAPRSHEPRPGLRSEPLSLDQEFVRNAAALLRPGSSALLALVRDGEEVMAVMSGYSHFVLHTQITWP